ncbi:hypothetical protein HC723_14795 [Vibrio sp. S11_S32]|uniref:hypothetical protein n=1 Tax=Vibrio sp. S11_S32 TaxID=2720225 RepID=UPI001680C903|nr:hypothetical protein [Vibrio sp. S11_S32]MBD1577674.1 hypothetical protein [Vibrio sp. S11_S32]
MATFIHHNKHKSASFITLSRKERVAFVLLCCAFIVGSIYFVKNTAQQRQYIASLNQYQYQFNQACQTAINFGMERDNSYCQVANNNNRQLSLALKDQDISLAEWINLKLHYQHDYQPFN